MCQFSIFPLIFFAYSSNGNGRRKAPPKYASDVNRNGGVRWEWFLLCPFQPRIVWMTDREMMSTAHCVTSCIRDTPNVLDSACLRGLALPGRFCDIPINTSSRRTSPEHCHNDVVGRRGAGPSSVAIISIPPLPSPPPGAARCWWWTLDRRRDRHWRLRQDNWWITGCCCWCWCCYCSWR